MAKFSTLSSGESRRTSSHLTSSSSAMIWASPVPTCWPISAFTMCIVTLPSGVSVNQIDGVKPDIASALAVMWPRAGKPMLIKVPAAVAAERTRNSRRVTIDGVSLSMTGSFIHDPCRLMYNLGGAFHGNYDARICGAATEIAGHAVNDLLLGWVGVFRKQRHGLHNLTRLAVAALRYLLLDPGLLHGMGISWIEALDGCYH